MEPPKVIGYILLAAILSTLGYTAKQAVVSLKDGKLNDEGASGFSNAGADILPFAESLRSAIDEKKEMLMISQNPADTGDKRIVGYVHSETDSVRDYNAKNAQAAAEHGLPPPEPLPIPEPPSTGHGHSHGGHGHSHGGHGHSHGHPAPTPAAPGPEKSAEIAPETVKNAENPSESTENAPKFTENAPNVAPDTVKPKMSEMDLEIERMIREEEERMAENREVKQEDLVLKSIPETPKVEQIQPETVVSTPEVAPEVIVTPPVIQEPVEPTTTPTPITAEEVPPTTPTPMASEEAPPTTVPPVVPQVVLEEPVTTTPTPSVISEVLTEEPVTPTAPVETPVLQKSPVGQDELTTPPPSQVVAAESAPDVTTTPTPPPTTPESVGESAHLHHGHSHDGAESHGHAHDAPEETKAPEDVTMTPKSIPEDVKTPEDVRRISPEEEEFVKWEKERAAAQAAPYEDAQGHQFQGLPPTPPTSAGIFDWIRSALSLGNVTDGTVLLYLILTFFLASLVFYVIVRSLSSGGDSSDVVDRQAYFDLVTKHKQLQIQLQQKADENQRLQQNGIVQQQQPQMPDREPEVLALRQHMRSLHNEIQMAAAHRQDYESQLNQMRDAVEKKEQQTRRLLELINDQKTRLETSLLGAEECAHALRSDLIESERLSSDMLRDYVDMHSEKEEMQNKVIELEERIHRLSQKHKKEEQVGSGRFFLIAKWVFFAIFIIAGTRQYFCFYPMQSFSFQNEIQMEERLERSSTEAQEYARQLDSVRTELTESQQSSFGRHQEFVEKQQETERLQTRIQELGGETRTLTSRIQQLEQVQETLEVELKDLKSENTGLLTTIQQLEAEIAEATMNNDEAGESGGSGWSDFGDADEVEEKEEMKVTEKTPENTEELRAKYKKYGEDTEELSKAKVRLSELEKKLDDTEKELSKYRNLYDRQKDQESRGVTESDLKLKTAETEIAELKQQILTTSGETNIQFQSLRDEKNALETKLKDMDVVIAKKEEKIREAEIEAKRVQNLALSMLVADTKNMFPKGTENKKNSDPIVTLHASDGSKTTIANKHGETVSIHFKK